MREACSMIQVQSVEVLGPNGFESAFEAAAKERVGAVILVEDLPSLEHRTRIAALAAKSGLPAMYGFTEFVEAGGLMAYGASLPDLHRCAAVFVDNSLESFRFYEREVLPKLEGARRGKEAA
jgi:putative ABC transport system substrate-binding protein